jgi:uncharacterized membrane protein YccF (DUF307 family)
MKIAIALGFVVICLVAAVLILALAFNINNISMRQYRRLSKA